MPMPKPKQNREIPSGLVRPADSAEQERLLIEAEAEIEAGHGTSGADVSAWLLELAAGRTLPPPCDR